MQQNGKRVQEVVIAAFEYVHHADQAAAHVAAHLHLHAACHPQAALHVSPASILMPLSIESEPGLCAASLSLRKTRSRAYVCHCQ